MKRLIDFESLRDLETTVVHDPVESDVNVRQRTVLF